jgi:hypothetical protein
MQQDTCVITIANVDGVDCILLCTENAKQFEFNEDFEEFSMYFFLGFLYVVIDYQIKINLKYFRNGISSGEFGKIGVKTAFGWNGNRNVGRQKIVW